ncbi:MAG TPA: alpha/beta fold hydrolase [Nevskia sp.]|jgi:predicted alpha/beta hydrolase|nr:alpha/beta fold hydrolase [Nevskia sp.]
MTTTEILASPDYELLCAEFTEAANPFCTAFDLRIPALDGVALAATAYEPRKRAVNLAVVINSATGVPRSYYRHFAEHLAAQGCAVLTYDYRGVGGSRDGGRGARMLDWGERDLPGALEWMVRYHAGQPLAAIGHSAGGWLFGLTPNNRAVDALLTVGAQVPHYRNWPTLRGKLFMWSSMNLLIPGLTRLMGQLPGAVLGGDSLPRGVALDWARWSRHRDFLVDDAGQPLREHFEAYTNPVRLLAIEDDDYAPPQAVRALAAYFHADAEVRDVRPGDHGLRQLGHFGYFRKSAPHILWDEALGWLRQQTLH